MIKRLMAASCLAGMAVGLAGGVAGAVPSPDKKNVEVVTCQSGTLAGETVTIVSNKTVYLDDGTQLRLTAFAASFGDKSFDKEFGNTQGDLTCGGSETSPEGTFTFLATLLEVS